jgi:hypothetical protein
MCQSSPVYSVSVRWLRAGAESTPIRSLWEAHAPLWEVPKLVRSLARHPPTILNQMDKKGTWRRQRIVKNSKDCTESLVCNCRGILEILYSTRKYPRTLVFWIYPLLRPCPCPIQSQSNWNSATGMSFYLYIYLCISHYLTRNWNKCFRILDNWSRCSTIAGLSSPTDQKLNQDTWLVLPQVCGRDDVSAFCVFDGHGPRGDAASVSVLSFKWWGFPRAY